MPSMRAVQVSKPGGPEALTLVDLPVPEPKPDEAIVEIKASGVNFIDIYYREGRYPAPLPFVDGSEGAGVVVALGEAVRTLRVGDRVAYTGVLGSYAEAAAVPESRLVRIPDTVDFPQAAASMLQGMTAHYLAHSTYPLKAGETALVHAAAGGVGLLLVQMAKRLGARVIGTVGSEDKARHARDAGADEVILYRQQDFDTEVRRLTGGRGAHVVYDGVGKSTFERDLKALRPRGFLVLFGGASGPVPPVDPMKLQQHGSLFLTRPTLAHYTASREELEERASAVLGWVGSGELRVQIAQTLPLAQAAQAHRDLEGRATAGKLLLLP
jgi:NADPH2:quinone reductase